MLKTYDSTIWITKFSEVGGSSDQQQIPKIISIVSSGKALFMGRGGFRLVGALGSTKCGGPPNKVFSLGPITCFESFRALVLLQIGVH